MDLQEFLNLCGSIVRFIINAIKFLGSFLLTALNSLGDIFGGIFNKDLFTALNNVNTTLSYYLGSTGATLFISLFIISFMFIIASFLLRFMRGRIDFHNKSVSYKRLPKS